MPITLATVNARTATVKIPIEGETLTVTYRRSVITPNFQSKLNEWRDTERGSLVKFTAAAVAEWDLLGEDGKPLPLDEETLAEVPSDIHDLIHRSIFEDMNPNSDSPATTGSGSFS